MSDGSLDPRADALVDKFAETGAAAFEQLGEVTDADAALLDQMVEQGLGSVGTSAVGSAAASASSAKIVAGIGLIGVAIAAAIVLSGGEPPASEPDTPSQTVVDSAGHEPDPVPREASPAPVEPVEAAPEVIPPEPAADSEAAAPQPAPTDEADKADKAGKADKASPRSTADHGTDEAHSTAAELLLAANRARRNKEAERARGLYRRLASEFPKTRERQISRVALGDLELETFGRPKAALEQYEAYLRSNAKGNLAEEALHGKARALDGLGRKAAATRAWSDLVRRFPDSLHAPAAKRRLDVP